ncbi:MAG: S49 family peptidase [Alphaproteobacteria bacterium]|nr:MAG: S49 family peptidase [Alphaproteobacteria bacterium]
MILRPHIAARLFGAPLMLARPKLDILLTVLGPRLVGLDMPALSGEAPREGDATPALAVTPEGIAVVPVMGTLVTRSGYLAAASGLVSYGALSDTIEAALTNPAIRAVLLEIDSPGGEVGGLFDLCDRIKALRQASGKPLWALAHENALSAAYAVASCADRLLLTQTAEAGSIGVVAVHVDESGADEQAGLAWSFIFAGDRKIDANAHEPLSTRARADIQADLDALYARLVARVARNRAISEDAVRGTEASIYRGERAVAAGLADAVMSREAALAHLAASLPRPFALITPSPRKEASMTSQAQLPQNPNLQTPNLQTQGVEMPNPDPVPPVPIAAAAGPPDPAALEAGLAQRLRDDYAELARLAAQAARLGVTLDVADTMARGVKADALRRAVLDELAARSNATAVVAAAPPASSVVDSPILRRARAAAQQAAAKIKA